MRVLDLCSGLGGWSRAFKERGHTVHTLDIDPKFNPTFLGDVRDFERRTLLPLDYDIILASPPCQYFSVARARWGYPPEKVEEFRQIALACRRLAEQAKLFWILENPRGKLRTLEGFTDVRETVFYCQYGVGFKKPTDLWGNYPWSLRLACPHKIHLERVTPSNGNGGPASVEAKRRKSGFTWAVNGAANRAIIPRGLSYTVCRMAERVSEKWGFDAAL